jgi:hypothetical protein
MNNTPTPLNVYRKEQKEQEVTEYQNKIMNTRSANQSLDNFTQSLNARQDTYIAEALKRVRESDVTHAESLTRINGTFLYNQTLDSSKDNK